MYDYSVWKQAVLLCDKSEVIADNASSLDMTN